MDKNAMSAVRLKRVRFHFPRLSASWLMAVVGAIVVSFSLICSSILLNVRQTDIELAKQTSSNLAAAMHADVVRNVENYKQSLRNALDSLNLPEVAMLSGQLRHLVLFDRASAAEYFGAVKVFNERGELIIDSLTQTPAKENVASEEYFLAHVRDANLPFFISKPIKFGNSHRIAISYRIHRFDGSFGGIVAGTIDIEFFHKLFRQVTVDREDSMTLLELDGTIIMRRPFDAAVIGRSLGWLDRFRAIATQETGSFVVVGALDGVERQYVWKGGGSLPLVVVVGKSMNNILSRWRYEAMRIGALLSGLALLSICFTGLLVAEMKRRTRAETKLAALANTDALTGLSNRRSFDKTMLGEWARAHRAKAPVSLLMIDADHFKGFNDTFGHQAGDVVLAGIASCIRQNVRRAQDCGARYGGEEFAVLLPGSGPDEAFQLGENIRLSVAALPAEYRAVTVSVGVATLIPADDIDHRDLIYAADVALYQAKSRGRNQTVAQGLRKAEEATAAA
jgi:diguanylate cyclase (GGDEF)-like protein